MDINKNQRVFSCPDCGGDITQDGPWFADEEKRIRGIGCEDCDWGAIENWEFTELQSEEEAEQEAEQEAEEADGEETEVEMRQEMVWDASDRTLN